MSTRANIVVRDSFGDELWFYRHSDGYQEGAMPLLEKFMKYVKDGTIRDNTSQACGWLILFGHQEYVDAGYTKGIPETGLVGGWKVGSIEPTTGQHGDIEYLYTIDLDKKTLTHKSV